MLMKQFRELYNVKKKKKKKIQFTCTENIRNKIK